MKYDHLNREKLLEKVEQFEQELKTYVKGVDQRYKVFFERNLAGIYRTKLNGEVLDCNDAMAQILGYENKKELIGQNASLLYYDLKDRDEHIELLRKNKFIKNKKLALKKKDGSKIWVSISTSEIVNQKNRKTEYMEGTMIDITELIDTQDKLIRSEENYKTMLDESPYGILIHENGKILYFNNRASEILNLDLKKLKNIEGIFPKKIVSPAKKPSIQHFDRVEIKGSNRPVFLDLYMKSVIYENTEANELSFVDIQDRIELEEEKIKTSVFKSLNDSLKKEIKEKEKVEKELTHSLETNTRQSAKLEAIFENSSHIIWTMDKDYKLTSFNANFSSYIENVYGVQPNLNENLLKDFEGISESDTKQWKESHDKVFKGEVANFITENIDSKGNKIYMNIFLNPIYNKKKKAVEASGIGHDITDKVLAESQLTESLKEKEILIKEIHHRVKNNLQVISSIFNLQSAFTKEIGIKEVLRESQNRIKSMSYIHESLYKSSELGKIDFEQYVRELSKNLIHSYAYKDNQVSLLTETESVYLELDVAIPCGLIVNEIVSNSLKHAFRDRKNGIIAVFLRNGEDKVKLRLTDDGVGIEKDIFNADTNSLGVQLIQTLVEQIKGEVTVDGSNGTTIEITFPAN